MKKKIALVVLFVLGLIIIIIPRITDYLYNIKVNDIETKYDNEITDIEEDNQFAELNEFLTNENNKLFNDKQLAFINQDTSFEKAQIDLTKYGFSDNIIGFLELPSIDIKLPIYLGASNNNMKRGAVHLTGTSYPIGGENTNSVIAAHRGYFKSLMFRHIDKISIGDTLYIKNHNGTLAYKAVKKAVIKPTELNKLTIQEGKDMVTIISCHPFPHNYQRYVVYFERVNNEEA